MTSQITLLKTDMIVMTHLNNQELFVIIFIDIDQLNII